MLLSTARSIQKHNRKIMMTCNKQKPKVKKSFCDRSLKDVVKNEPLITQAGVDEFRGHFPAIVKELTQEKYIKTSKNAAYFEKLLNYVVPTGHCYRGLTTVAAYKILEENLTPDNIKLANFLGWIIELSESGFVLVDDIIDNTAMRRGVPSWYALKNKDPKTIMDGKYLENSALVLLKTYFSKFPCYFPLLQLFLDVQQNVTMGQLIDSQSSVDERINWDLFNMDFYSLFSRLKAGSVVLHLPTASAMYFANIHDENLYNQTKFFLTKMGEYYQIQNDYTDCFENIKVRGFPGNDIREGKLSWLAVLALQKATPGQTKLLKENYGKNDDEAEKSVKTLYEELKLEEDFIQYKHRSFDKSTSEIKKMSDERFQNLFFKILESLYKYSSY